MRRTSLALVLVLGTAPALAAAQGVLVETAEGLECQPFETSRACVGGTCSVSGEVCRMFGENGFCASREALICGPESDTMCPAGLRAINALGFGLCVETDARLCGDAVLRACFTKAGAPSGSAFPVAWIVGDCDGDGLANGDELADGVCAPAPRIGVSAGDGCDIPPVCHDACVGGACVAVEGTAHRYCLPGATEFVFCCGGIAGIECPDDNACQVALGLDDFGFCDPFEYCRDFEFASRLACLQGPGGFPVPPDEGDCDGDGVLNGAEEEPRDPCVVEADAGVPPPDAGDVPPPDAGAVPPGDAGSSSDDAGSASMDGAAAELDAGARAIEPRFGGGGGCRCGAAPPRRGAAGLALLVVVALSIARRRQGA